MFYAKDVISDDNILIEYIKALNTRKSENIHNLVSYSKTICSGLPSELQITDFINQNTKKKKDKGFLGKFIEFVIFGQYPNSKSSTDFSERDLKITHFYKTKKGLIAKERITITNCGNLNNLETFDNISNSECIEDTRFINKIKKGLLFVFLKISITKYDTFDDILNQPLIYIVPYNIDTSIGSTVNNDFLIIKNQILHAKQDQNYIQNHIITQKGQNMLHIHPHGCKGSNTRALGFKQKSITELVGKYMSQDLSVNNILKYKGRSTYLDITSI